MNIDHLVNLGQLNKKITLYPTSLFPQVHQTERPDYVAFSLTEGKIAILMDNSTFCGVLPVGLFDLYITSGDYGYTSFWNTSYVLFIRYVCTILATALPALYVSLVAFHPELLPETLALSIAESRLNIPLTAPGEAFLMMFALDILVEASMRLPSNVGQTIGIVGALIIGTAAVEAGIVSTLMVIVISFTAIASFTSPSWELVSSLRITRYGLLFISSLFGLYGFVLGFCLIYIHLCNIDNFSRPYLAPFSPIVQKNILKKIMGIRTISIFGKGSK